MVCQTIDGVHEEYEGLKQKILSWASNKMSHRKGPVPMDVGRVDGREFHVRVRCGRDWQQFAVLQMRSLGTRFPPWTRELARVAREAETVGDNRKRQRVPRHVLQRVVKLDTRPWECRARNVNAVQEESEGEMEEVVDVGAIWNVRHVETVDVMAVVGGEPPTSADEAEAARRQNSAPRTVTNWNTSAGRKKASVLWTGTAKVANAAWSSTSRTRPNHSLRQWQWKRQATKWCSRTKWAEVT